MTRSPRFTEPVETYTVLTLRLADYPGTERRLPPSARFLDPSDRASIQNQEVALLRRTFDDWHIPVEGKLAGLRADSPVLLLVNDQLAGGVYLCAQNEFHDDPSVGQLHYAYLDTAFQGQGLYSLIFREAIERARRWGLDSILLNSDRYMLPEVYLRWGARPWRIIEKHSRIPNFGVVRWMRPVVSRLRRALRRLR